MTARDDLLAIPDEFLRRGLIVSAVFVHMDFLGAPRRWWTGFGDIEHDGHLWQGVGDVISISDLTTSYSISAQKVTFQLAATQEMLALALAAKARVRNRAITISQALLAREPVEVNGRTYRTDLDGPLATFSLFSGTMQKMPWSATGSTERTLSLECEGLFFRRNAAPRGRWSDADQRARFSGDRGLERLPLYQNGYETEWRG